ncbi:MAG: Coenzyme F420 hydrogenase/dehydrogenase, beta subunit C-terminal domain [Acidimicrobiia bacterium]|nr:Coenzyme F420 hydrogenase/dehydrogenase, beta subunit C-terminal domain [Acidimicrobiia bacterium]
MLNPGTTRSIADVVANDLCVGCGLCEAVTHGRVTMTMTDAGSLRPSPLTAMTAAEDRVLAAACPGVVAPVRVDPGGVELAESVDPVWGASRSMVMAWAGEPEVRFKAATGGVLTALGRHLLSAGDVAFVLHVGPDPDAPTRSRFVLSESPDEVLANTGSRYGPTAPLAGLGQALDRGEPFAVIAKPCDLGAVHAHAAVDSRVEELCRYRLAMVCGGQSRLTKTLGVIDGFGLTETEVTLMRYRGHGNPGLTRVESRSGAAHELTYLDMWADESGWDLETRCKLCPDALGECADIAAADAWPGGAPTGEDDGFNAIVVRTGAGERLVGDAAAAGRLVLGERVTADQLNDFQPHQVRKKVALAARYQGMADAGVPPIHAPDLRRHLDELGATLDPEARDAQRTGTARRFQAIQEAGHR